MKKTNSNNNSKGNKQKDAIADSKSKQKNTQYQRDKTQKNDDRNLSDTSKLSKNQEQLYNLIKKKQRQRENQRQKQRERQRQSLSKKYKQKQTKQSQSKLFKPDKQKQKEKTMPISYQSYNYTQSKNQNSQKYNQWLNTSSLLYDQLIITKIKQVKSISQIRWSNFNYLHNPYLLSLASNKNNNSNGKNINLQKHMGLIRSNFYVSGIRETFNNQKQDGILTQCQIWSPKTQQDLQNIKCKPIVNILDVAVLKNVGDIQKIQQCPFVYYPQMKQMRNSGSFSISQKERLGLIAVSTKNKYFGGQIEQQSGILKEKYVDDGSVNIPCFQIGALRDGPYLILKQKPSSLSPSTSASAFKNNKQTLCLKFDNFSFGNQLSNRGLLSGHANGQIMIWNLGYGQLSQKIQCALNQNVGTLNSSLLNNNNNRSNMISKVFTCKDLHQQTLKDLSRCQKILKNHCTLSNQYEQRARVLDLAWMPLDSQISFISTASNSQIFLWDLRNLYSKQKNINSNSQDNISVNKPAIKITSKIKGHTGRVKCVCPLTKNLFLTAGSQRNIVLWDIRNTKNYIFRQQTHTQVNKLISLKDNSLSFLENFLCYLDLSSLSSNNNNKQRLKHQFAFQDIKQRELSFASCNSDGSIILWNQKMEFEFVHQGHQNEVLDADYMPFEQLFISGEKDKNTVMIWRAGMFNNYHEKMKGQNLKA